MARQEFIKRAIDLECLVLAFLAALTRQVAAIGLHDAQLPVIELIGALEPLASIALLARQIEDHAGVQALEDVVPVRSDKLVDRIDRGLVFSRARLRPGGQQRAGEISDRRPQRLGQLLARDRILLLLDRPHAQDQPRDAIVLVDLYDPLSELDGFVHVTIGEHGQERAAQQFIVARITPKRCAIVVCSRSRITLYAGVTGGKEAAGNRGARIGRGNR